MEILKDLNQQQLEAVKTTEGYVRVIAGAGSGKTRALVSRYAYLVNELGISPSNILSVTFTNKASKEMRNRVQRLVNKDHSLHYITTFHGFCVKVLREDINKIQYPKGFIILDAEDQKTILREIYSELNITSRDIKFKQCLAYINRAKSKSGLSDIKDVESNNFNYINYVLNSKLREPTDDLFDKIFLKYLEKQQRNFALDFNDLIEFTLHIFTNYQDVLEKWQDRMHYVQVDEAQDNNLKQCILMEMISNKHKNLFIVGDPDQTIYEWRGASAGFLIGFDKEYEDVKTIIMNQNYRSTPNILDLGNHLIKNNSLRIDKDMVTENKKGVDVVHYHADSEFNEGVWVANEINRLLSLDEKGNKIYPNGIAVLYRASYISRAIEQALMREKIPYVIFGGIRFFERKEIKDVLSYLRLIQFGDDFSFLRVINFPKRGLGKKFIDGIREEANSQDKSLLDSLLDKEDDPNLRPGALEFISIYKKLKASKIKSVSDFIKIVLDKSGVMNDYRRDGDTDRLDNINELLNSIISIEKDNDEELLLVDYLQEISLYTDMDNDNSNEQRVKLMTIHASKGLEFPYVFLCGFTEGVLPSSMSLNERGKAAMEEERRLAYVAITRAEKGFYMTESEGYNFRTGLEKYPSRFLFEISENFYVREGTLDPELIKHAKDFYQNKKITSPVNNDFELEDIVTHSIWGKGEIKKVNNKKGVYEIFFFDTKKTKPINFDYAKMNIFKKKTKDKNSDKKNKGSKQKVKSKQKKNSDIDIVKGIKNVNKGLKVIDKFFRLFR
ncbi:UvrD-helicase domain-containing protein [Flavobacteriales bacterium]|nr:UvrD-helicase domain-containing protein [Flavobacteriales bacterium]